MNSLNYVNNHNAGYNPDHVYYSPTHRFIVTADEGEPPQIEDSPQAENQVGGATILDTESGNVCSFQFDFGGYSAEEMNNNRIHRSLPYMSHTNDMEPEFVSFDPQSTTTAFLTIQEASAIVTIDLDPSLACTSQARVISIRATTISVETDTPFR